MCEDKDKWTTLHYACKGGHMNIVQYLITELGCDSIVPDIDGSLLLPIACGNGHLDLTKYLITEQGCDVTVRNYNGWTPVDCAYSNGHTNIVIYLTELGLEHPLLSKKKTVTAVVVPEEDEEEWTLEQYMTPHQILQRNLHWFRTKDQERLYYTGKVPLSHLKSFKVLKC